MEPLIYMYCTYIFAAIHLCLKLYMVGREVRSCLAVVLAVDQQLHSSSCDCCLLRLFPFRASK